LIYFFAELSVRIIQKENTDVLTFINGLIWFLIPIRFLWLTLLAASSASSTYLQYASGASSLPPRYLLKAKWYQVA